MSYETLLPESARTRLDEGWTYLDVRSVEEFAEGHVPGAYNIPLLFKGPLGMQPNPDFLAQVQKNFEPGTQLVLGCKAGGRSAHACEALAASGFTALVNMDGGFHGRRDPDSGEVIQGWAACGLPTTLEAQEGRTYEELG